MKPTATFLILSLLWGSLDGAADIASAGHAHESDDSAPVVIDLAQPPDAETIAAGDSPVDDPGGDTDSDKESHCEHCCHGHTHAVVVMASLSSTKPLAEHGASLVEVSESDARAPPTPPPNA